MLRRTFSRLAAAWRSLYTFDRPGCQVRLSIQQWLPFAVLPLLLLWYLASPTPVAILCAAALAGLILSSYLWARSMARRVRGQRRLRYAAFQVGDELEEQVTLANDSILPAIWAEFYDTANLPGYTVSSVHYADSHATISWRDHTTCTRRGLFRLGPWELRLGDPFGLFRVRQVYLEKNEILVYPPLAPLPERLLPRGQVQGEERPLNQPLRAETQDAFTARPYQPGDPLRHIHWPVTARHDALHVRVFEPEASSTVWLVADLDAAAHSGQGSDSSLENMIILLASLAAELLRRRVAVGLLAYSGPGLAVEEPSLALKGEEQGVVQEDSALPGAEGEDAPLVVTPQRGPLHLWDLLRVLATLEPAPGRPFSRLLARAQMLVGGRDQVLAVTPSLDPAWLGELYHFHRGRHSQGAGVILLDPASFGPSARAAGAADTFASVLTGQGMRTSVVRQGELRPVSGSYGELSRWEFKVLGTGRVFVRHAPKGAWAGLHPLASPAPSGGGGPGSTGVLRDPNEAEENTPDNESRAP
jgi:uncharacterized protein (DUF58 family)